MEGAFVEIATLPQGQTPETSFPARGPFGARHSARRHRDTGAISLSLPLPPPLTTPLPSSHLLTVSISAGDLFARGGALGACWVQVVTASGGGRFLSGIGPRGVRARARAEREGERLALNCWENDINGARRGRGRGGLWVGVGGVTRVRWESACRCSRPIGKDSEWVGRFDQS